MPCLLHRRMKPPYGSMREQQGGYGRHQDGGDDGDLLSLSELHGLGDQSDMLDSTETLLVQQVRHAACPHRDCCPALLQPCRQHM